MHVVLLIVSILASLASFICWLIIVIDSYRSGELWEFLLTAFTPYFIYYAIFEFEHDWKWPIAIGAIGGASVAGAFYKLSLGLPP